MKTNLILLLALLAAPLANVAQNVGVGVPNPTVRLDIAGDVALNDNRVYFRGGLNTDYWVGYQGGTIDGFKIRGLNGFIIETVDDADLVVAIDDRVGLNVPWDQMPGGPGGSACVVIGPKGGGGEGAELQFQAETNAYRSYYLDVWQNNFRLIKGNYSAYSGGEPKVMQVQPSGADSDIFWWGHHYAFSNNTHSDLRIKNVKAISNNAVDLNTLMKIEVTDYTLKMDEENKAYKKLIAQQVEEHFPQVISYMTNVIPDIQKRATINNGYVDLKTDLKVGEIVRLLFEDKTEDVEVINTNASGFYIDLPDNGEVLVYGREVNDFRTIDYEGISILNLSATQEQQRLIEDLQKENAILKATINDFQNKFDAIEAKLGIGLQNGSAQLER